MRSSGSSSGTKQYSGKAMLVLCLASFLGGSLFTTRAYWSTSTAHLSHHHPHLRHSDFDHDLPSSCHHDDRNDDDDHMKAQRKLVEAGKSGNIMEEVIKTHLAIQSLDKTISTLEMEVAAARTRKEAWQNETSDSQNNVGPKKKAFVVIGINTAFSSKRRRDSVRESWMARGESLKKLEKEKGIVMRFVIGHSTTPGGMLDKGIDAEEAEHHDFLRLTNHVEGYHHLSSKTRIYFSTAFSLWDATFYVKVDDDVHLNVATLASTLAKHRFKPRVYIGCMKSGPVLSTKGVKYHEPEFWKFGDEGNKYFRHATGQIYGISKDLASYISINSPILHRYANEDVSLGSWFIGLEVEHVDDRSMCCGTPPDCEWKAEEGNVCVASFDWQCSGICKSVERMKSIHNSCGEGNGAVWSLDI